MRYIMGIFTFVVIVSLLACQSLVGPVSEIPEGYQIQKGTTLVVILKTPLSSNINKRGDSFVSHLKEALTFKDKAILPKNTQIRGLVKRATRFEKLGDRANLLLLFDQIVLPDGKKIPLVASLDTDEGSKVIKIEGKAVKDATIIGGGALVGTLAGRTQGKEGAQRGLVVGTVAGASAVLLSNAMEVKLPVGTELTIKLQEPLLIPK
ncbi:MAG: hypothetical protein JSW40_02185 [Candidatus Omnitrophota bacterium]|nr:MAG: hypothetical protein JSW40_02185 [Candidatus Omnitrophota bacterium]